MIVVSNMRMLPPIASALVAHVWDKNLPVSLIIHRKDNSGMVPVTAKCDEEFSDKIHVFLEKQNKKQP